MFTPPLCCNLKSKAKLDQFVAGRRHGVSSPTLLQTSSALANDAVRTINAKKLTPLQWEEVLRISRGRRDFLHPCPICLERFGLKKQQVILSCSHAFHKLCLQSFEKFSRIRCCPICRAEPYQKNVHVALSKALCAERIQSAFRGYYVRKKYSHLLPCRRQCFLKMLASSTDHLLGQLGVQDKEIDELFKEIDETVSKTNQDIHDAQQKASQALTHLIVENCVPEVDWQAVITKAEERYDRDCPICIAPMQQGGKPLSWLSCSHMFHRGCISAFEAYNTISERISQCELSCPICRANYQRLDM
ncbi:uncharacterized protein [Physcomitrium patens]|uniref:uncharacterized protein isoform X2 n=1 Tax=Physcomitrium patens TaxID=3218 RepID=UPI000D16D5E2|nr:RING finger protein 32-like isoform X2 [Physcomitrium patens]XP_024393094.1 RING finger protein 32-like isoform X2 [Physcomitrium patens]|eukprot:XP_024393093.1 RING finger protein 32-like isoform X2 [Physcomitrella patens]